MAIGTDGNNFAGRGGRSDTDGNLGLGKTGGQQEAANDGEQYFLHYAISLIVLLNITPYPLCKLLWRMSIEPSDHGESTV
jgi:hypothetical protein